MIAILSHIKLNHHNKQNKRQELVNILRLILKNSETIPHCNYLSFYAKSALECFIFTKSKLTNNIVIDIVNKNKLKNILTFLSKRDCYSVECMNKLIDLYYEI